jgi:methionyl-tRNA synthetase
MTEPQAAGEQISFDEFNRMKLRIAKVVEVTDHPNADKLLVMQIDLGDEKRQIVAGLRGLVAPEKLLGANIVVVTNLAPAKLRGVESNGMLLAARDAADRNHITILTTADDVAVGSEVS